MANGNFDQLLCCLNTENNEENDLDKSKLLPYNNNAIYKNNIDCCKSNQDTQETKINKSHELFDLIFDLKEDGEIRKQLSEDEISTISDDSDIYADIPAIEIQPSDTSDTESDDGINIIIRDFKSYGQLLFSKNNSKNFYQRKGLYSINNIKTTKYINNTNTVKCNYLGHVNNKQWRKPEVDVLGYFNCEFYQTTREASSKGQQLIETEAIPVLTSVDCEFYQTTREASNKGQQLTKTEAIPVLTSVNCEFYQTTWEASSKGQQLIETEATPVFTSVDCEFYQTTWEASSKEQQLIETEAIPVLYTVDYNDNTKKKRNRGMDPLNLKIINTTEEDNNTMFTSEQSIKNGKDLKIIEGKDSQSEQKCSVSCSEESSQLVLECMPNEESYSNFLNEVQNKNLSSEPLSKKSPKSTSNSIPKNEQSGSDSCYEESLDSILEDKLNGDYNKDFLKPLEDKKTNNRSNCKGLPDPVLERLSDLNSTQFSQTSDYHSTRSTSIKSWISDDVKEPPKIPQVWNNRRPYRGRNRQRGHNRRRSRSWSRSRIRASPPRRPHTSWDRSRNRYRGRKRDRSRSLSRSARGTAPPRSPPIRTTKDGLKWQESSKAFEERRSRDSNRSRNRHCPRHRDRSRSVSRSRRYRMPSRSPPRKRYRR